MSSGGREEGWCKICGDFTKSITYKFGGICKACDFKKVKQIMESADSEGEK